MPDLAGLNRFLFFLLIFLASFAARLPMAAAATLFERSQALLEKKLADVTPDDYSFVVLGDSRDNDQVFIKALKEAAKHKPLFILHTGDYSSSGSKAETDHFLEILRENVPNLPVFVVLGNHEQRATFEQSVGPAEYTLNLPPVSTQLVVEDDSRYFLKKPQLEYLDRQLAGKNSYKFVAFHIPPKTDRWSWHTFSEGASELIGILAKNRVSMAFFGHIHIYDEDTLEGVRYMITGGAGAPLITFGFPGDPSHHIVVVRVKKGSVSKQMVKIQ